MARSPLFGNLTRLFRVAQHAHLNGLGGAEVSERLDHARSLSQVPLSRRQFLYGAAGLLGTLPFANAFAGKFMSLRRDIFPPVRESSTVIIVGAGLAGLTTAYFLRMRGYACALFEADSRLGGRMYTEGQGYFGEPAFNRDRQFYDLGGEWLDSTHTELIAFCEQRGIPIDTFSEDLASPVPELFFADGKFRSEAEVVRALAPLVEVVETELQALTKRGVIQTPGADDQHDPRVVSLDRCSLEHYLDRFAHRVEPWLLNLLKVAYTAEYGGAISHQSALNLLVLWDQDYWRKVQLYKDMGLPAVPAGFRIYGVNDDAKRIGGGSSTLIRWLESALYRKVPVYRQHRLTRIDDMGTSLRFWFATPWGPTVGFSARRAVLAIPFSVLRDVYPFRAARPGETYFQSMDRISPKKMQAVRRLDYGSNTKVILGFRSREPWLQPSGGEPPARGLVATDFNRSQQFWEMSRLQAGTSGILTCHYGGEYGERAASDAERVDAAREELGKIYPDTKGAFDGASRVQAWRTSPFHRGAYTSPSPGQYTEFLWAASLPELGRRLFFAGEHTCLDFQGFMYGAFLSGKRAAEEVAQSGRRVVLPAAGRQPIFYPR